MPTQGRAFTQQQSGFPRARETPRFTRRAPAEYFSLFFSCYALQPQPQLFFIIFLWSRGPHPRENCKKIMSKFKKKIFVRKKVNNNVAAFRGKALVKPGWKQMQKKHEKLLPTHWRLTRADQPCFLSRFRRCFVQCCQEYWNLHLQTHRNTYNAS